MATEQTGKTAGNSWCVTVNRDLPPQQSAKPVGDSWSVTVNRDTPDKQVDKLGACNRAVKVKHEPAGKLKLPLKRADMPAEESKNDNVTRVQHVKQLQSAGPSEKAGADSNWSVNVNPDQPAKHKPQILLHREHGTGPLPKSASVEEKEPQVPTRSPSAGSLVPISVCIALGIAVCAFGTLRHRTQQKEAQQRTAQAYMTVTSSIARVEELKRQTPGFEHPLDGALNDLKPSMIEASSDKDLSQHVSDAILAVKTAETRVLDADTGQEQAKQALELLAQHPEHQSLSVKLSAGLTEFKNLQHGVEAKCQSVRSLIMAANPRVDQYKWELKNRGKK